MCCQVPSTTPTNAALCAAILHCAAAMPVTAGAVAAAPFKLGALLVCPRREEAEDLSDMMRAMAHHARIPCYTMVGGTQLVPPPAVSQPVTSTGCAVTAALPVTAAGATATAATGREASGSGAPLSAGGSLAACGAVTAAGATASVTASKPIVAVATPGRFLEMLRRGLLDTACTGWVRTLASGLVFCVTSLGCQQRSASGTLAHAVVAWKSTAPSHNSISVHACHTAFTSRTYMHTMMSFSSLQADCAI